MLSQLSINGSPSGVQPAIAAATSRRGLPAAVRAQVRPGPAPPTPAAATPRALRRRPSVPTRPHR